MIGKVKHIEAWFDSAAGKIEGYAAPIEEIAACTIHFRNGGQLVSAARAVHFTRNAINLRAGWCGFSLPVAPRLFLFDDSLDLCCGGSGRILLTLCIDDVGGNWAASVSGRRFAKAVDLMSSQASWPSVEALTPLLKRIIERKGATVAAEAMCDMLLRRAIDQAGLAHVADRLRAGQIERAIEGMLMSEEYAALPVSRRLLSPFDYGAPPEMVLALMD